MLTLHPDARQRVTRLLGEMSTGQGDIISEG